MSQAPADLDRVIDEVVRSNGEASDRLGAFPRASVDALGSAGFLGPLDLADAASLIERLAAVDGSAAMIVLMHHAALAVLVDHAPASVLESISGGSHLCTLAFSEAGSRSHFWAPVGTAVEAADGTIRLDAKKSWVTSAAQAASYVWSSRPLAADAPMTLWLVPSDARGLDRPSAFDGLGLRGNGSVPVVADGVIVPAAAMLGEDGAGLDLALTKVLPVFLVLSAAFSLGLMEAVVEETGRHLTTTRLEHLDETLAQQPLVRTDFARMKIRTDGVRAVLRDTLAALAERRADATLLVLEVKAVAAEAAIDVTDLAMKVCGGAAFRKELGIERRFRDARAARVMAPTTDALLDFVGRAITGQPLLDA